MKATPIEITMNSTLTITEIVRSWTAVQRRQALTEIVRDLIPRDGAPILIEEVGVLIPNSGDSHFVEFDGSTSYLREIQRRAETPEDSEILMEIEMLEAEHLQQP
jgi:hypothetical protein